MATEIPLGVWSGLFIESWVVGASGDRLGRQTVTRPNWVVSISVAMPSRGGSVDLGCGAGNSVSLETSISVAIPFPSSDPPKHKIDSQLGLMIPRQAVGPLVVIAGNLTPLVVVAFE